MLRDPHPGSHLTRSLLSVVVLLAVLISTPARAENGTPAYDPIGFQAPLHLSRGELMPASADAVYLDHGDSCRLIVDHYGWSPAACEAVETVIADYDAGIDTIIVEAPNSDGYVSFDDWTAMDSDEAIDAIWAKLVDGARRQSADSGYDIRMADWRIRPHLNKDRGYLYYATLIEWDGETLVNVKATLFDRHGYVTFRIVPVADVPSAAELTAMVERVLEGYRPKETMAYRDFRSGDKVAGIGLIGVLATLAGVQVATPTGTGLIAIAISFLGRLWFLLVLPVVWLWRAMTGGRSMKEA